MTEGQRLKQIRDELKLNQVDFAKLLELEQGSISDIERGKAKGISPRVRKALIKHGANPDFIDSGKMPIFVQNPVKKDGVPVYNVEFAGGDSLQFGEADNHVIGYVNLDGFKLCKAFVRVKGSSMYPNFVSGDFIGLEPVLDLDIIEYGQPYAIETKTDQRLIKFVRRGKDNENLVLRSANAEFDDMDLPKSKIRSLFKVHGPIRDQWQ